MTLQDDFLRKAAVLIATLDDQTAETLLSQLGRDQALLLQRMLGELAPVTVDDRSQILQEFIQASSAERPTNEHLDAVEVDDSLAAKIAAADLLEPDDESCVETAVDMPADSPLSFLAATSPEILGDLLAAEHPQTISVVLANLSPAKATRVLRHLPPDRQSEVLQRLGQLPAADESLVAEIEQELQRLFERTVQIRHSPRAGLATVHAILEASSDTERRRLVDELRQRAPEVLQEIHAGIGNHATSGRTPTAKPSKELDLTTPNAAVAESAAEQNTRTAGFDRPGREPAGHVAAARQPEVLFEFDDLNELDDKALALVFHQTDPEVALVALTGAGPGLLDRIQRQLSWREARQFKAQIGRLGPIRLSDVERAQQKLAEVAAMLIQQGVIPPPKDRRFIIAA